MRYHEAIRRIGTALPPSVRGMLVNHRIPSMKLLGVLLLPPGWNASPSQDTHHEVTRSIRTDPLDWMLVHHRIPSMKQLLILVPHPHPPPPPLDGMLVHHLVAPRSVSPVPIYTHWVKRDNVKQCILSKKKHSNEKTNLKPQFADPLVSIENPMTIRHAKHIITPLHNHLWLCSVKSFIYIALCCV